MQAVVVPLAIAAVVALSLGARWHNRDAFLAQELANRCEHPARLAEPLGEVTACRVLDSGVNLSGTVDCYIFFLLNTTKGLVGVRLDYYNTAGARQHVSIATEIPARDLPGLSDAERAELEGDIQQRGGVHPTTWTVHYGDG